jgi:molybdopterin synthase catalytic subunit
VIKIQKEDFNISNELDSINILSDNIGSVVSFIGKVRPDDNLISMTLECYETMAVREIEKIINKAKNRWDIITATVIHRYGKLYPGDNIVLIITASEHRSQSIEANQFIIDYLKTEVPIWKNEEYSEHKDWVKAKESDLLSKEKW